MIEYYLINYDNEQTFKKVSIAFKHLYSYLFTLDYKRFLLQKLNFKDLKKELYLILDYLLKNSFRFYIHLKK
jgi:hypothetical protein